MSCSNCRQRKIKCLKVYPCPHCVRGGLECIFPARKKDRAPRRNKNSELLNRLAKLEAIVGQVDPAAAAVAGTGEAAVTIATASAVVQQQQQQRSEFQSDSRNPQKVCPQVQPISKNDPAAKYVSGEFWANLSTEVEGIKTVLEQPSEAEDESDTDGDDHTLSPKSGRQASYSNSSSNLVSAAIFGNPQSANATVPLRHPPPERIKKLRDLYFRNVDMLIKILHRPTIEKEFDLFIVNPEDNSPSQSKEALYFAMYFAAITSLSPERCQSQLGEDRAVLSAQYRQAVELALARADYLNNTSLECLQALTIYSAILRFHTKSRSSWALLALVYRLCQAHGLHRDGSGTAFTPYEAELRRRLWAQIIVLDVRAAQDRGTEPMIREADFNTVGPTNINDDAFHPDITVPLSQLASEGPTDVTFSRCTYACSCLYLHIHGPHSDFAKPSANDPSALPPPPTHAAEDDVIQRIKGLEDQFIIPALAHPTHFPSAMAAAVVRLTSLIFWLTIQYPFRVRQPTTKPRVSREHMLQTAVVIMELQAFGPSDVSVEEYEQRFSWWKDGYVQWHALSVALAELCVQTEGVLVDRAWATVDRVMPLLSHQVADSKKGALWRPIRKLLRKARERRAEAQLRRLRIDQGGVAVPTAETERAKENTEMLFPLPSSHDTSLHLEKGTAQGQRRATATDFEPNGIPFNADFSDMSAASNASPGLLGGHATALPPMPILQNAAHQWTIDFDDVDMYGEGDIPQQELDMMDWSAWNDFVNDANVSLDDNATTPGSNEGKDAETPAVASSSIITEREMPVGSLFV